MGNGAQSHEAPQRVSSGTCSSNDAMSIEGSQDTVDPSIYGLSEPAKTRNDTMADVKTCTKRGRKRKASIANENQTRPQRTTSSRRSLREGATASSSNHLNDSFSNKRKKNTNLATGKQASDDNKQGKRQETELPFMAGRSTRSRKTL